MSVLIESNATNEIRYWYALRTASRAERKVFSSLQMNNYSTFLPLIPTIKQWSDRKKKIHVPLLPGFIFVHATHEELMECLRTQGVLGVIRYLGKPAKVQDFEIAQLKILINAPESVALVEAKTFLLGEVVTVIHGPFSGLKGKCIRKQGQCKVVVELKTLGREVQVNIPVNYLEISHLKVA